MGNVVNFPFLEEIDNYGDLARVLKDMKNRYVSSLRNVINDCSAEIDQETLWQIEDMASYIDAGFYPIIIRCEDEFYEKS